MCPVVAAAVSDILRSNIQICDAYQLITVARIWTNKHLRNNKWSGSRWWSYKQLGYPHPILSDYLPRRRGCVSWWSPDSLGPVSYGFYLLQDQQHSCTVFLVWRCLNQKYSVLLNTDTVNIILGMVFLSDGSNQTFYFDDEMFPNSYHQL